jgi:hypothetical protein
MSIKSIDDNVVNYQYPLSSNFAVTASASAIVILVVGWVIKTAMKERIFGPGFVIFAIVVAIAIIVFFKMGMTGIVLDLQQGTITYPTISLLFWKKQPVKTINLKEVSKVFIEDETRVDKNGVNHWYKLTLHGKNVEKNFSFKSQNDRDNLYTLLTDKK